MQIIPNDIKVLITGGAGFIGSNIAMRLALNGNSVRIVDNLSTGSLENLAEIMRLPNVEFVEMSICDTQKCLEACKGMDVVLHQAALGSVPRSIANPIATNNVNVDGFLNMLWAAKENGIKRFVYASSSSVYGDDKTMPKIENRTGNLLSPYAVTKSANEAYAKVFSKVYGVETVGLRYFNVFGPNQNVNGPYAAVIPLFVEACLDQKSPIIFGDGSTTRDFTYVDNVVNANLLALVRPVGNHSPVVNVAYGSTTSLNKLFEMIAGFSGFNGKPQYGKERIGDIKDSWADISAATALLGYAPVVGVEDGLKRTVDWFRSKKKSS